MNEKMHLLLNRIKIHKYDFTVTSGLLVRGIPYKRRKTNMSNAKRTDIGVFLKRFSINVKKKCKKK